MEETGGREGETGGEGNERMNDTSRKRKNWKGRGGGRAKKREKERVMGEEISGKERMKERERTKIERRGREIAVRGKMR